MNIALTTTQVVLIGITLLVLLVGVTIAVRISEAQRRLADRLVAVRESAAGREGPVETVTGNLPLFQSLAFRVGDLIKRSHILSPKTIKELEETVRAAGYRSSHTLALFIGAKVMGVVFGPMVAWLVLYYNPLSPLTENLILAGSVVLGLLLPDWVLRKHRKRYLAAVETGLPDGLDLLVICTECGLAFEGAIDRCAEEMKDSHPELATEFGLTAAELRLLPDRRQALLNMGDRTGLEPLKRFSATLAQTLQYGTPLVQALRVLSAEMRQTRITQFEERAARLPVLLTLPMIMFILPCTFVIVGGPAVVSIIDGLAATR